MSDDLHRAIQERGNAFRPDRTPSFQGLRDRKRRRDQRRAGAAVALSVAAVLGVAVVPSALGSGVGGAPSQIAGPEPSRAQDSELFGFGVDWTRSPGQFSKERNDALLAKCFSLPGVEPGSTLTSLPPAHSGRIVGTANADAFRECAEQEAPGAGVSLTRIERPTPSALAFEVTWEADAYDGARAANRLKPCLDLPGVSSPVDPFFTRPPSYTVTVTGAQQVDAFRSCLAALDGLEVKERPVATGGPDERTYTLLPGNRAVRNTRLEEQRAACLALPGIASTVQLRSEPPQYRVVVVGEQENQDFQDCVRKVVGLYVPEVTPQKADTATYLDNLYACLNAKGYKFTKGPDGGWSGQVFPADVPYEQGEEQYKQDEAACQRSLGVNAEAPPFTREQGAFVTRCVGSENAQPAPEFLGLTEEEVFPVAATPAFPRRLVGRDGECLGRTRDLQGDRVNVILQDGKVIWAGRF